MQYGIVVRDSEIHIYRTFARPYELDKEYFQLTRESEPVATVTFNGTVQLAELVTELKHAVESGNFFDSVEDMDSNFMVTTYESS